MASNEDAVWVAAMPLRARLQFVMRYLGRPVILSTGTSSITTEVRGVIESGNSKLLYVTLRRPGASDARVLVSRIRLIRVDTETGKHGTDEESGSAHSGHGGRHESDPAPDAPARTDADKLTGQRRDVQQGGSFSVPSFDREERGVGNKQVGGREDYDDDPE